MSGVADMKICTKKIDLMHELFGSGHPSDKCGTCMHLMRYTANRSYFKCECYGETSSDASDWRKKYPSCGLYNVPYDGIPIIEYKKHMPKQKDPEIQCEGQIKFNL